MGNNSNSVSFNTGYPKVCMDAYENDEVFNIFKTIPEYTQILEHTSVEFGQNYIDIIKRDNPWLLESELLNKFKTNDLYGSPTIHQYDDFAIAPSTLRYIKVLSDLTKLFGPLDGFKIAEIGGGYGGQCKIINDCYNIKGYHIIDLHQVNMLSGKYLNKLDVKNVRHSTNDNLNIEEYDLIISNYAYTELDRNLQDVYKKHVIDGASNGYITCNFIIDFAAGGQFDTYSKDELLNLKNNTQIMVEEPLTAPKNFIEFWKK